MASKFLDTILPNAELYVPGNRDRFTVVPGGMPNGDPSLRIGQGNNDGAYTARVLHTAANASPFTSTNASDQSTVNQSITFWIKPHPTLPFETVSTGLADSILFGVHTPSIVGPNLAFSANANNTLNNLCWWVHPTAPGSTGAWTGFGTYFLQLTEQNVNGSYGTVVVSVSGGMWNLVRFNRQFSISNKPRWTARRISAAGTVDGTTADPASNGLSRSDNSNRWFSLGPHEQSTSVKGMRLTPGTGDTDGFEIGKLAFRYTSTPGGNVSFTDFQLSELYDAMVNGPPS